METTSIKSFINRWKNKGDEKSDTQAFWLDLLHTVLNVENPVEIIEFEKRVELDHVSFIDAYIPSTHVIIEQKSINIPLDKAASQSDGQELTPFGQAKRYSDWLPASQRADWIVTCNFKEIQIHDMEKPKAAPEVVYLADLETQWPKLQFLIDVNAVKPKDIRETAISVKAGELVGKLYRSLSTRYKNPDSKSSLRSLNILCVRIVFLLFAEDVGIFNKREFHDYMLAHKVSSRRALMDLFTVLSQKPENRDPYTTPDLMNFPYVNGGLFEEQSIEIPLLDGEPLDIILHDMSDGFDWSGINPPIFGAIFESTLNKETRQQGGMHYTTLKNIHKVIDPLFLDKLKSEVERLLQSNPSQRELKNFRKKLTTYKFFDPACGSGNFLTETYLSLCQLEMKLINALNEFPIHLISINQFYGIEINDFAVAVAKTALWIADIQMSKEVNSVEDLPRKCLPLENYNNIREGNALTMDWREVVEPAENVFILGNPPFRGARVMAEKQKSELNEVFKGWKNAGNLDYVSCWYKKAADYMKNTSIKAALVSTNSVTQGDSVGTLWKPLFSSGIHFSFAWRTFVWNSEAKDKAHVHCVIIGFGHGKAPADCIIYDKDEAIHVKHINAYLVDAPDIFVESRQKPLFDVPEIGIGNKPIDDGNYLFKKDEMEDFIKKEPQSAKYFHAWYGADEFINSRPRYCLYLGNCAAGELRKMPECLKRVEAVKEYRLKSTSAGTRKLADTPTKFHVTNMPEGNYIVIPQVSSERRAYIPIGFMDASVLCSDRVRLMPNATLYYFGILESSIHMAWMRMISCRLKSDYSYTIGLVYNTFPWPSPTDKQRAKIEATAQAILDARDAEQDSSLADLYDERVMPVNLRNAHRANDEAVLEAYGFPKGISEEEIVTKLMISYSQKVKEAENEK